MSERTPIENPKIELVDLLSSGWELNDEATSISKSYKFASFRTAIAWMTRMAFEAEALNHHPEWFNVYSRVDVTLTTHDTGGLTVLDKKLAERMDKFA